MKERPILFSCEMVRAILDGRKTQTRRIVKKTKDSWFGCELAPCEIAGEINNKNFENSKFGQIGDRLWVRETFGQFDDLGSIMYRADGFSPAPFKWTPSIHCPRWASRILLEITGIRVERLNDISEEDAIAEGVGGADTITVPAGSPTYRGAFKIYWQNMHVGAWKNKVNTGAGSWEANPWVWVIEFKRVNQ